PRQNAGRPSETPPARRLPLPPGCRAAEPRYRRPCPDTSGRTPQTPGRRSCQMRPRPFTQEKNPAQKGKFQGLPAEALAKAGRIPAHEQETTDGSRAAVDGVRGRTGVLESRVSPGDFNNGGARVRVEDLHG